MNEIGACGGNNHGVRWPKWSGGCGETNGKGTNVLPMFGFTRLLSTLFSSNNWTWQLEVLWDVESLVVTIKTYYYAISLKVMKIMIFFISHKMKYQLKFPYQYFI